MKPSELRLFLILCVAVFLAVNMIGLHAFLNARIKVKQAIIVAKSELASDQSWLVLAETLHPAFVWVNAHPMPEKQPDEASAELLKFEREEVEKSGLKVTEENLLPGEDGVQESHVAVEAKLSGPFESVVRLLFALQSSRDWREIQKLSLRSDTQPPNVLADLELRQYFHPGATKDSTIPTPQPAAH